MRPVRSVAAWRLPAALTLALALALAPRPLLAPAAVAGMHTACGHALWGIPAWPPPPAWGGHYVYALVVA